MNAKVTKVTMLYQSPSPAAPFWLGPLEILLNKALALDPLALAQLQREAGKTCAIQTSAPQVSLTIAIQQDALALCATFDPTATLVLEGPALTWLRLLVTQTPDAPPPMAQGVSIRGDLALLQTFAAVVRNLDLDWEELLAPVLGNAWAGWVGFAARRSWAWGKTTAHKLVQQVTDYWQDENPVVARETELSDLSQQIYKTRLTIDRLEQRIQHLSETELSETESKGASSV